MAEPTTAPLEPQRLTDDSRTFAERLFTWQPAWRDLARMASRAGSDRYDLVVDVPSPIGDPSRGLQIWVDDDQLSVGFGEWHTHASLWRHEARHGDERTALLDLLAAIVADQFVLTTDVGGEHDGDWGVLDLREPDALLESLTSPIYAPPRLRLRSWTGAADAEVGPEDLRA